MSYPIEVVQLRDRSKIFNSKPIEIQALRLALGWSQGELAGMLGAFVDWKGRSPTVSKWENGKASPSKVFRARLVQFADAVAEDYKIALRRLKYGKATARRPPVIRPWYGRHRKTSEATE